MRPSQPIHVQLTQVAPWGLAFDGERGERFQIAVLEHDLLRVSLFSGGQPRLDRTWMIVDAQGTAPREGRLREDYSPFALPGYAHSLQDQQVQLRTAALQVEIALGPLALRWHDAQGRAFATDDRRRAYQYDRTGRSVFHYLVRRPTEHYYGLGERAGALDKHGGRFILKNVDAYGYDAARSDPLYKHFPFYITYVPELGLAYGLLYDNLPPPTFDLGQEIDAYHGPYRSYQVEDGDVDYYLIFGPSIGEVVRKLARLTGHMALPPRWSLGFMAGTMGYTEAPDAQHQLQTFVERCQAEQIPCDLFHLSSGYTTGEQDGKRYVFNWNRSRVPDPPGLARYFRDRGMRLAGNIKPWLLLTHPQYAEVAQQGGLIQAAEADEPEHVTLWSGGISQSEPGAYLDFTHPAAYAWWQNQVRSALLEMGVSVTWNDNNEYEIWDDAARCDGFGQPIPIGLIRPLHSLLMTRASWEAQQADLPDERPFVICRSGMPGVQRYAQTWSGDNYTRWESLRYNIAMGLGLSLSGAPNMGHDIGGLVGPKPDPELFLRWLQCGVFQPRFHIHSLNDDGSISEPWMYPKILPLVRQTIQWRYRLLPYLYSLFYHAHRDGDPMNRPLVYEFPEDARCRAESFDFLLGSHLLVPPIFEEGVRHREVYLPAGSAWHPFYGEGWLEGGQSVALPAPLEHLPLLVRAGGIIPMGKAMQHVGAEPDDQREVYLFPHPGAGSAQFELIEDDGLSLGYQRGEVSTVGLGLAATPEQVMLTLRVSGGYALPYSEMTFILPPGEARPLEAPAGARLWVGEDGRRRATVTF
ncbi:MAG: alpha-glucosidase [Anaerolineae bacterium]|nr:alpha-glucosidase [Anaerolineae bacterium]